MLFDATEKKKLGQFHRLTWSRLKHFCFETHRKQFFFPSRPIIQASFFLFSLCVFSVLLTLWVQSKVANYVSRCGSKDEFALLCSLSLKAVFP